MIMVRRIATLAPLMSALVVALVASGCGSSGPVAASAEPDVVVRSSPDRTFQAVTARVEAAAPDATSKGQVRFDGAGQRLRLAGRGAGKAYPELEEPRAVVDLVRGATMVEPYGGAAVRGASTFRYQILIDTEKAVAASPPSRQADIRAFVERLGGGVFYADVWIDGEGRLRRVQLPLEKTARRPVRREAPRLITVDLFDFGS